MPRMPSGKRIIIKTLSEIMNSSQATIAEKLEACRILAGLDKPKPAVAKPKPEKLKKSSLLG